MGPHKQIYPSYPPSQNLLHTPIHPSAWAACRRTVAEGAGRSSRRMRRSEVLAGCFERLQSAIPEYRSKNRHPETVNVSVLIYSEASAVSGSAYNDNRTTGGALARPYGYRTTNKYG